MNLKSNYMVHKQTRKTIEGNVIIATFLGIKTIKEIEKIHSGNRHLKDHYYMVNTDRIFIEKDVMRYSTSWDWLIPVWAKLMTDFPELSPRIVNNFNVSVTKNDIKKCFNIVVSSIQVYNTLKKK